METNPHKMHAQIPPHTHGDEGSWPVSKDPLPFDPFVNENPTSNTKCSVCALILALPLESGPEGANLLISRSSLGYLPQIMSVLNWTYTSIY